MSQRWSLSVAFALTAVAAGVAQAVWIFAFLGESTSEVLAYCMSLLGVVVVPIATAAAAVALLPPARPWLRPLALTAVAVASVTVAATVASVFLADDLPEDPLPAQLAMDGALAAIPVLVLLLAALVFRVARRLPAVGRGAVALIGGLLGAPLLMTLLYTMLPMWIAAVAMLVTLLVLRRSQVGRPTGGSNHLAADPSEAPGM